MPAKKYSVEQIIAKLREHEKLQGQGLTVVQACKRIGISDHTFFRWRTRYGALKEDEAQRLKAFGAGERPAEADRGRPDTRHLHAQGAAKVKMVSPARCRDAVSHLIRLSGAQIASGSSRQPDRMIAHHPPVHAPRRRQ